MSSRSLQKPNIYQRLKHWASHVLFYGHWSIGVIDQPIEQALGWAQVPNVRWIEGFNGKRYLADPFAWPGRTDTLLCEAYNLTERIGRIVALKIDNNGIVDEMPIDLPLKGHLSFPFLFQHGDDVYLMPEASDAKRLEIFRWYEGKWVSYGIVFENRRVADAVLFEKDNQFWIAYTDLTHDPHDNLHLIYAPSLTGPWLVHPANPIQRGKGFCRGAGAVFTHQGKFYRPAQDCSQVYGGAVRIMEIVTCTPTLYEEREVAYVAPTGELFPDGFHTINKLGHHCLVDGMRESFSLALLIAKVRRRIGLRG